MNKRDELLEWIGSNSADAKSVAALLNERTGDKVSDKTVERWIADPAKSYSRKCPGWVIYVLTH